MVSKEEFQGWILDYASYHRIFPVIQAILLHHSDCSGDLPAPHLRLACATIDFIIESEQLSQFDVAIELMQQINNTIPPLIFCQKTYLRLLTGLKIKALFQQLQEDPDRVLVKLNTYFPRTTKFTNPNQDKALSKFNQSHKNFRCFFFSLVSNDNQLHAYLRDDYNAEFGPKFMESIKKLCGRFLQQIESQLLPPMIEKVLACSECEKFSKISPATEILLDFVQEKKLSSQSDMANQEHHATKQKGHRSSYIFTQQQLFEMLTVSSPIYTQDWLAFDHRLNLSSPDLFDSFNSQGSLPQQDSLRKSFALLMSNSQELRSDSLVPLTELQDGLQQIPSREQGSSESHLQVDHQQKLQHMQQQQQQLEAVDSSLVSEGKSPSEEEQLFSLKCAEQQSAAIQCKTRQLQSMTVEIPLQTEPVRGEDQSSVVEMVNVGPCQRFEEEMEHAESQTKEIDQPLIVQDEIQISQAEELKENCMSAMAEQDVRLLRQEAVEKNLISLSERLERSPHSKSPLNDQEIRMIEPEPGYPQNLSQMPDIVQSSESSKMSNVSLLNSERIVVSSPPNITSTPVSLWCQPTTSCFSRRQEDNDSPTQTPCLPSGPDPDPLLPEESIFAWPENIRLWLACKPKTPSCKLLRSKVFRSSDLYGRQHQQGGLKCERSSLVNLPLETKSSKHSSVPPEENLDLSSCLQSDETEFNLLPSQLATPDSTRLSTDLSSISSGSSDIVSPSDPNSAEAFYMDSPDDMIDSHYNFLNQHLLQGIKACIIKLYRNQQLDVVEEHGVYNVYS